MSRFRIRKATAPLVGETTVPGDKSIGHRALMLAALGAGRSRVLGLSGGEDNLRTLRALSSLGVVISDEGERGIKIHGRGIGGLVPPAAPIDCGNSGTTMRLLSGVLASCRFASVLIGDEYLHARPMGRVAGPLGQMGARIAGQPGKKTGELYPPLVVGPAPAAGLSGIDFASPIASAQVKSAVLLAGLAAEGITRVREPHTSRDHTERMLRAMGAPIVVAGVAAAGGASGAVVTLDTRGWNRELSPRTMRVPGDFSSAAFVLAAALLVPGSRVTVRGVGLNPTRTGALDAMRAMGGDISVENLRDEGGEPVGDLTARGSALGGIRIAGELALRAIDELPLLSLLAAHADGETVIADASELRVKESDRIAATAAALRAFGVAARERPDGLVIAGAAGRPLPGARVESRGDHRIAMASAICALAAAGDTLVEDVANVATSFPGFHRTLSRLGASAALENEA